MSKFVLYDLSSKDGNICWSPYAWKVRLSLNYKGVDYDTHFLDYPEVAPTLKSFGMPPGDPAKSHGFLYSIPSAKFPDSTYVMESMAIVEKMESFPEYQGTPSLHLEEKGIIEEAHKVAGMFDSAFWPNYITKIADILTPESREYFERTRSEAVGMSMAEFERTQGGEQAWQAAEPALIETAKLLKRNKGPYLLGDRVCYGDLVIAALWRFTQRVTPSAFDRLLEYDESFKKFWAACEKWVLAKQS